MKWPEEDRFSYRMSSPTGLQPSINGSRYSSRYAAALRSVRATHSQGHQPNARRAFRRRPEQPPRARPHALRRNNAMARRILPAHPERDMRLSGRRLRFVLRFLRPSVVHADRLLQGLY
jgi:hypothetical protein